MRSTLPSPMSASPHPAESPWRAGWESARQLFWPGLVLQSLALGVVLVYYFAPAARGFFERLAELRLAGGLAYSGLSTVLCGGVLPFVYLHFHPVSRAQHPWRDLTFYCLFWLWKGIEVDFLYRGFGALFGTEVSVASVVPKVLLDMLVYNPLYAAPVSRLCFGWKDAGYRWAPVLADVRAGRWYARRVLPVQLAVWCVWLPVVICIYSLPAALQMPLNNIVLCFWSLLFAGITTRKPRTG